MEKIIIIGAGGHAKCLINIIQKIKRFKILGYVNAEDKGAILDVKFLGTDQMLPVFIKKTKGLSAAIGIGYVEVSDRRKDMFNKLKKLGYKLPAIVSPDAIINKNVQIGDGTLVCDGVVINVDTKIGKGVILNTRCSVDHDCVIEDFVHVCPGAVLSGGVVVGELTLIGVGASIVQYKTIASRCLIGAGAVVVKDCQKSGTYVGIPAKTK
jgi:sugar O-acyltransferase (sialic acid O-acetyltransferase NeuD family)